MNRVTPENPAAFMRMVLCPRASSMHPHAQFMEDTLGLKEYMCKNAGPRANARDLAVFGLLMLLRVRRCAHARALALEAAQECTRRTMGRDLTKSSRQGR